MYLFYYADDRTGNVVFLSIISPGRALMAFDVKIAASDHFRLGECSAK